MTLGPLRDYIIFRIGAGPVTDRESSPHMLFRCCINRIGSEAVSLLTKAASG